MMAAAKSFLTARWIDVTFLEATMHTRQPGYTVVTAAVGGLPSGIIGSLDGTIWASAAMSLSPQQAAGRAPLLQPTAFGPARKRGNFQLAIRSVDFRRPSPRRLMPACLLRGDQRYVSGLVSSPGRSTDTPLEILPLHSANAAQGKEIAHAQ